VNRDLDHRILVVRGLFLAVDLTAAQAYRLVNYERLFQRGGNRFSQAVAHHGVKIQIRLAGRRLQVLARAPADADDVSFTVDHYRGRHVQLQ